MRNIRTPEPTQNRRVAIRTYPLCEATCGLEMTVEGNQILRVRGDRKDVFSHGFLCPKGSALGKLHEDPDRLRHPILRKSGLRHEVSWRVGWIKVPVEVTDMVMPGVVSLPHGWGHGLPGTALSVPRMHPGVNSDILTDEERIDPLSGNAVLNGIPVRIKAAV